MFILEGICFFFPTHADCCPNALLEATSCGKPLIVRDIKLYDNWLFHGKNCLKGRIISDFVSNINLLRSDEAMFRKLERASLEFAYDNDISKCAKMLSGVYESLIEK